MNQTISSTRPAAASANMARWLVLLGIIAAIVLVFVVRTVMAHSGNPPRLFEIFEIITVLGSLAVLMAGFRALTRTDWLVALAAGLLIGVQLPFATLFNPFPYLDLNLSRIQEGLIRGLFTSAALLGGLVIMRWGGPVQVRSALGQWGMALRGLAFGALIGIPLAVLNGFANAYVQTGSASPAAFVWQNPLAAAIDAIQPALYEDIFFRLAFPGLLWLALRKRWSATQAAWISGILALLVHNYGHYSDLFRDQPVVALGMGAVMGLIWGLPLTVLALKRDLESSVGFHWVQDAVRFFIGF